MVRSRPTGLSGVRFGADGVTPVIVCGTSLGSAIARQTLAAEVAAHPAELGAGMGPEPGRAYARRDIGDARLTVSGGGA